MSVHPAKTLIRLGGCPVWSESSLCAQWVAKDPKVLHADSEDSDQTGRMPRLIWVFAGRTVTLLVLSCRGSVLQCSGTKSLPIATVGYFRQKNTKWCMPTCGKLQKPDYQCRCHRKRDSSYKIATAIKMSRLVTKPTKWVCAQRRQISLGIRPVWSESSLSAWRQLGSLPTHWAHSEDPDQTGRMPRLIWVFAGRKATLLVLSRGGSNVFAFLIDIFPFCIIQAEISLREYLRT